MCYLGFGSEFAFGYILKHYKLCFWDAGFSNQYFKATLHQELSITGQESIQEASPLLPHQRNSPTNGIPSFLLSPQGP